MSTLYEKLEAYGDSDFYGFHMPGHKRNQTLMEGLPAKIDITEIDGFDDLHHAEGILKESQAAAARLWHADECHFLVNGSTVGILSALLGTLTKGDRVLMARHCHQSVYHAVEMGEFRPVYLYPKVEADSGLIGSVTEKEVRAALTAHPDIRAVVIPSPTYDGVVSEVARIAEAAHEKGIPLIVDEAHGAHFGFHPYFPENADQCGADVVIHSLHKTLPALTQTALLDLNGDLVDRDRIRHDLHMLTTSSPSYVLMASIDHCISLLDTDGPALFEAYVKWLQNLREELASLAHLRLVRTENYDPSKLVISVRRSGISSRALFDRLAKDYHLQMEMAAGTYVLGLTSLADTDDGLKRLKEALFAIDAGLTGEGEPAEQIPDFTSEPTPVYTSSEMAARTREKPEGVKALPYRESVGQIANEYLYLYPPGSPLLVPGERITAEVAEEAMSYEAAGFVLRGTKEPGRIEVWMDA